MSKTRTFIAIEATDEVQNMALETIHLLRPLTSNVNWVVPDNLHWTLQFLGDVGDVQLFDVCREVAKVAAQYTCFSLSVDCLNAFPSATRPRTIWLGSRDDCSTLICMQTQIEDCLSDLGFRPEARRYIPHLTLGRVGKGSHAGEALGKHISAQEEMGPGTMTVEEVIIFGSELDRDGPTYHVLGRAPLADD
ncbi:MAG: RNA 2',3'-cyclic phosphodiesterase [Pirellulales bacterium]|nr:RNA 2',3'-cyclic phosphodiesterase [Pirellulales bacterium]HCK40289.1 RNA 2',3'-cyclic phosphodiesterase [Planctomycetaceae bacterium]